MVADEVHRLQSRDDPECRWFQGIAEHGHYAGRVKPTNTRQGIYMATPNGKFLGSLNSTNADQVLRKMQESLASWEKLSESERLLDKSAVHDPSQISRNENKFPEQGLVLQVFSRDLPRDQHGKQNAEGKRHEPVDWRADAWNQDHAWFKASELDDMLPNEWNVGATRELPNHLLQRIARAHLVDNVRGQTPPYQSKQLQEATWSVEIVAGENEQYHLRYQGLTECIAEGRWSVNGFKDMSNPESRERGVKTALLGFAVYDRTTNRFLEFELIANGTRWGGTQYNGRADDLDAAPIGYYFKLAGDRPSERVAPELFHAYGW